MTGYFASGNRLIRKNVSLSVLHWVNFDQLSESGHYSNSVMIIRFCIIIRNMIRALPITSVLLINSSVTRGVTCTVVLE